MSACGLMMYWIIHHDLHVLSFTTCTPIRLTLFLQLCFLMLKMIVLYKDAHQIILLTDTVGYKSSFELLPNWMINYWFTNPISDVRLTSLTRKHYPFVTTKSSNWLTPGSGTVTNKITATITSFFHNWSDLAKIKGTCQQW